jgi:hypothetical protein
MAVLYQSTAPAIKRGAAKAAAKIARWQGGMYYGKITP